VRVVTGDELVNTVFGVPRLVSSVEDSQLRLQLLQTYLPTSRTDLTVTDFNDLTVSMEEECLARIMHKSLKKGLI